MISKTHLFKNQPISCPSDVKRFFVSPEESGQICMLACMLGKSGEIFFFTKLSINNQDNPKAGYIIFVEGVSIFNFDNDSVLNEKEKADLIYLSGLSIAINNLRAFISNLTSSFPLGKYQIPTIDIIALHSEKKKQMKIKRKNNS
jgi:hypothetical protein